MGLAAVVFFSFVAFFSVVPQISGPRSLPAQEIVSRDLFVKNARFLYRDYVYIRPARKAIMVDAEGQAVRTADGMQMTRRDRSVKVYAPREEAQIKMEPQAAQPVEPPFAEPAIAQDEPVIVMDRELEPAHTVYAAPPLMPPASPLSPSLSSPVESTAIVPASLEQPAAPIVEPAITPIETAPTVASVVSAEPLQEVESPSDRAVRQVYRAIFDDPALTEDLRATLQVTAAEDVLTIRGNAPNEEEKQRFGRLAREASEGLLVENQLSAASA